MKKKPRKNNELFDDGVFWSDPMAKTQAWFSRRDPVRISEALLEEMKDYATQHGVDVRVCLHDSPAATFHDMVILKHSDNYYRPHRHRDKGETWHVIEGILGAFVFDEAGNVVDACRLSPEGTFLYRIGNGRYHVGFPVSPIVIFHESKPGPFLGAEDSFFADWAPDGSDSEEAVAFRTELLKKLPRE